MTNINQYTDNYILLSNKATKIMIFIDEFSYKRCSKENLFTSNLICYCKDNNNITIIKDRYTGIHNRDIQYSDLMTFVKNHNFNTDELINETFLKCVFDKYPENFL